MLMSIFLCMEHLGAACIFRSGRLENSEADLGGFDMAEKSGVAHRSILVRSLTAIALVVMSLVGVVAFSTTPANAWRGRGFYGGRGRGYGRGYGFYGGPVYVAPPVYGPRCYWSRRWGRTVCR